jgi:hypothetical protein
LGIGELLVLPLVAIGIVEGADMTLPVFVVGLYWTLLCVAVGVILAAIRVVQLTVRRFPRTAASSPQG